MSASEWSGDGHLTVAIAPSGEVGQKWGVGQQGHVATGGRSRSSVHVPDGVEVRCGRLGDGGEGGLEPATAQTQGGVEVRGREQAPRREGGGGGLGGDHVTRHQPGAA